MTNESPPLTFDEQAKPRESTLSPIVLIWEDEAHHKKQQRIEGGRIEIPRCGLCRKQYPGGRHFCAVTLVHENDPDAFKHGASDVQRSKLWTEFTALLDLIQGRDGIGNLTRRWCVKCSGNSHDVAGACACACHPALQYFTAVTDAEQERDSA